MFSRRPPQKIVVTVTDVKTVNLVHGDQHTHYHYHITAPSEIISDRPLEVLEKKSTEHFTITDSSEQWLNDEKK